MEFLVDSFKMLVRLMPLFGALCMIVLALMISALLFGKSLWTLPAFFALSYVLIIGGKSLVMEMCPGVVRKLDEMTKDR